MGGELGRMILEIDFPMGPGTLLEICLNPCRQPRIINIYDRWFKSRDGCAWNPCDLWCWFTDSRSLCNGFEVAHQVFISSPCQMSDVIALLTSNMAEPDAELCMSKLIRHAHWVIFCPLLRRRMTVVMSQTLFSFLDVPFRWRQGRALWRL